MYCGVDIGNGVLVYVCTRGCCVQDVVASSDIRSAIGELRQILSTPIRVYDSAVDQQLSTTGGASDVTGRWSSESDCLDDADLPTLITRVLGKRE